MPATVLNACKACFAEYSKNCSGFVRAVAGDLGIVIESDADANAIADLLKGGAPWVVLADGPAAAGAAAAGQLVVAGLRGDRQAHPDPHGHVVVVVGEPLAHGKYPTAWWGSLRGQPGQNKTLNWAWNDLDRDNITYASQPLPRR